MAINKKLIHFKTRAAFEIQLAENNILDTSIVFIQDAKLIWTHGTYYGKYAESANEIYIGTEEPTNGEVVWINPDTDEMKYWNGLEWVTVSGKAISEETLIISLASNQTNPDSNLNGVIVNVRYADVDHKQAWGGEALSFNIPDGTEYTIEYSDITDENGNKIYATPTMETYTAVGNETRTLSRYYNQTRITITRSSNLGSSDTLGSSTATLSCSSWSKSKTLAFSDSQKSVTVGVLTGDTISIVFSGITNYSTPTISSFTAEGATMSKSAVYSTAALSVTITSNQTDDSSISGAYATVTYNTNQTAKLYSGDSKKLPLGTTINSIVFSNIIGYLTPTVSTPFTLSESNGNISAQYKTTVVTIKRTSNISIGNSTAKLSYGNETLSFTSSTTSFTRKIPWGTAYTVTFNDIKTGSALQYNTPSAVSKTANETAQTVTGNYTGCSLTVQRTNNQGATMSTATSATVTYSSYSQTVNFTSSTNSVTITIPYNVSYTIKFNGTITNYRTPANITGTSNANSVTKSGSYDSEKVTVNVSGLASGFTITVNGQSQTATSGTYYIAYGTTYTISASSVKGYTATVSESSITANSKTRTVTVTYAKLANGIYICDTSGNLTAVGSWNTANNSSAIGVAVVSDNCSFVIGKTQSNNGIAWSDKLYGTTVSGIKTTTDSAAAKTDYVGESNSSIVRGLTSGETNAFNWAYGNTIIVNGTTLHGYIGALGEWQTAYNNKSAIDSALSTIGGTAMLTGYHWASTQYSSNTAWILYWSLGGVNTGGKNYYYSYPARAFYPIP